MKRLNHKHLIALVVIALLVFLLWPSPERSPDQMHNALLPWNVHVNSAGHVRVLGLELGVSTLNDASHVFGSLPEVAVFQDKRGLSGEGFFSEFTSGGLTGRIIVTLDLAQPQLEAMVKRNTKRDVTETGTIRYRPSFQDIQTLKTSVIKAITYIPYVDLSDEIIRHRFGEPAQLLKVDANRTHYLYPDKGMDVLLDKQGKEVVQYVNPAHFADMEHPLEAEQRQK